MKSYSGYLKQKLGDSHVLLAGGSHKSLSDFLGSISWDATNKKILYKASNASNWSDLLLFGSNAFNSTGYLPLSGGTVNGPIYFGQGGKTFGILEYDASNPNYGIWYKEDNVDKMMFSATGNANDYAQADLAINGNGSGTVTIRGNTILHAGNYSSYALPLSGGTLSGLLTVSSTGSNRATIHLISAGDVPNDLYFGSHGVRHWSLTSRSSGEGHCFYLYNNVNPSDALYFFNDNRAVFSNSVTASSFIKNNGTSAQFLKADGSVDNTSYLPLTGGTLTGDLTINTNGARSSLYVVTPSNNPCDIWLGANNVSLWSLTCRASNESYNFDIYSNLSGAANGGHVVVFNQNGRVHFYNSIHEALHLCVGSDLTTYDSGRAEVDICTPTNAPSELWYGIGGSRMWSVCCRDSSESYIMAWYSYIHKTYRATLDHSGNLSASNFYTSSDRNKKQNISSFSEHIRKFQFKDTEKWHYGVIAQEVPEIFREGEEGNMTVNYNSVLSYYVGLLENKVKELEEKIKLLETKQQ